VRTNFAASKNGRRTPIISPDIGKRWKLATDDASLLLVIRRWPKAMTDNYPCALPTALVVIRSPKTRPSWAVEQHTLKKSPLTMRRLLRTRLATLRDIETVGAPRRRFRRSRCRLRILPDWFVTALSRVLKLPRIPVVPDFVLANSCGALTGSVPSDRQPV